MKRRDGLSIKKKILQVLKENGEMSLGEIERKTNSNNLTIKNHIKELEFFEKIDVIKHSKSEKTGRPYTSVRLKQ
ncbi:MAG: helix-turn-helix domain-containing protein [Nanoarchaeota archaeon]